MHFVSSRVIKIVLTLRKKESEMKKIFLSPFFTPLAFLICWGLLLAVVLIYFPEQKFKITEDGQLLDIATYSGYAVLICGLLYFFKDFSDNKSKLTDWFCFMFLSVCAVLREAGIQHHLSATDTTPFKSKFFFNPQNPLSEKIIFGLFLLFFFCVIAYLAVKYTKHLIASFFKLNTVTWSTAVLCCDLVFAKFADRFPANWRKAHDGILLPRDQIELWSLLEESSELFLPLAAFVILWQYHLIQKSKA